MTTKVSIMRRWVEPVPRGPDGQPIPKAQWPRKRRHVWVVRWFAPDGTRPQVTCQTKQEAERIQAEKAKAFDETPTGRTRPRKVTVGEFVTEFLDMRTGARGQRLAAASWREARTALRRFEAFVGASKRLDHVTRADVMRFLVELRKTRRKGKPLSPATTNKTKGYCKAAFTVATEHLQYIRVNPFTGVKDDKVTRKTVRYVSRDELCALLEATQSRRDPLWWRTFIALCYTAGLRLNEAMNLTWREIDFEHDRIELRAKPDVGNLIEWQPKGRKDRTIPIPTMTVDLLVELQTRGDGNGPYVLVDDARLNAMVAARQCGTKSEGQAILNNVRRAWQGLCKRAGVGHTTMHDLRRSAITNWARALPIHIVQELAGHVDIKTTQRFYLAFTEADMATARRATEEALREDV